MKIMIILDIVNIVMDMILIAKTRDAIWGVVAFFWIIKLIIEICDNNPFIYI